MPGAICLCVDDVGLQAGINLAALHLAELGRVHALSCMVGGPAWASVRGALRRLDGHGVDLGLHLDLTECPLLAGSRRPLLPLMVASYLRQLDRRSLAAEIHAQLATFEEAVGHPPAFVDGHQHVHQLPGVRLVLLDALHRRYGDFRPWLRSTRTPGRGRRGTPASPATSGGPAASTERFKPALIGALGGRGLRNLALERGHAMNGHLLGVYDFCGGADGYRQRLSRWLGAAQEGDLLMCHPARRVEAGDAIGEARLAEYQVLGGAEFGRLQQEAGVQAWPMSQILVRSVPVRRSVGQS